MSYTVIDPYRQIIQGWNPDQTDTNYVTLSNSNKTATSVTTTKASTKAIFGIYRGRMEFTISSPEGARVEVWGGVCDGNQNLSIPGPFALGETFFSSTGVSFWRIGSSYGQVMQAKIYDTQGIGTTTVLDWPNDGRDPFTGSPELICSLVVDPADSGHATVTILGAFGATWQTEIYGEAPWFPCCTVVTTGSNPGIATLEITEYNA